MTLSINSKTAALPAWFKNPYLLLAIACLCVYAPTVFFGYTFLDDATLIENARSHGDNSYHLFSFFFRGVLTGKYYYRPILMVSFVIDRLIYGRWLPGYHITNMLLHTCAVMIGYCYMKAVGLRSAIALILSLFFAVHPLNSQAVAWLPGRNEVLLAIFCLLFLLSAAKYTQSGKPIFLISSAIAFLLALFTKESAIFILIAFMVFQIGHNTYRQWHMVNLGVCCSLIVAGYLFMRMKARVALGITSIVATARLVAFRLPLPLQYLGKMLLPVQLSVYPNQNDTSLLWGCLAVTILVTGFAVARHKQKQLVLSGLLGAVIFIIPLMIIPPNVGFQSFEHRAYLSLYFILISFGGAIGTSHITQKIKFLALSIAALLAAGCIIYQQNFSSPLMFWRNAVRTSPSASSAYALLACYEPQKSVALHYIEKARKLNPELKLLNFRSGYIYMKFGEYDRADTAFRRELYLTGYAECYKYLAQLNYVKHDTVAATNYMKQYRQHKR